MPKQPQQTDGRAALLATLTEREWQAQVVAWAKRAGWYVYHTYDSRRSPSGFPDLVLVKPLQPVLFVELKSMKGRVTDGQWGWLQLLSTSNGARAEIWRPDAEAYVKAVLGV